MKYRKFYNGIPFHFINVAIINSWILYRDANNNEMPLLEFKAYIANSLLEVHKKRGRRTREEVEIPIKKRVWTKTITKIHLAGIVHFSEK